MSRNNKAIVCADKFSMSVQASEYHYCSPRINKAEKYESVEIGYPTSYEPLLVPYEDGPDSPVFGFVPVEVVREIIKKHGGMVSGELPPGVLL